MYQARYGDELYYEVAERFTSFARERGLHPASLAVAWVASHPAITAPIIGARNLSSWKARLNRWRSRSRLTTREISALARAAARNRSE
jgi:aryl-alcohol dehydrogenase-like predicted oxidoreductase